MKRKLRAGDTVECRFENGDKWYSGKVLIRDREPCFFSRKAQKDKQGHDGKMRTPYSDKHGYWFLWPSEEDKEWRRVEVATKKSSSRSKGKVTKA